MNQSLDIHELYMHRCMELARQGAGHVAPNPMVGAVLVYENRVIGEGYHRQYGYEHAEVNCIRSVRPEDEPLIARSVLYVSLEPCAHYGKTPPCADLILSRGIPSVVVGCRDPFPAVNGRGIEKLLAAGITVRTGVMEQECVELNRRFFTFHEKGRPHIILKWAQSADGRMAAAEGGRLFISNEYTNRLVHKWRAEEAGILVGTRTALADNPALTVRHWAGPDPVRLVIDASLRLPETLRLFDGTVRTIVFNTVRHAEKENLLYYRLEPEMNLLPQLLKALYGLSIQSVLVEGGAAILQSFIDEGCWDEARVITNDELMIGKGLAAPVPESADRIGTEKIFTDTLRYYKNKIPK